MYMEQLARPFIAAQTLATRRIVAKNKAVTKGIAIIQWGNAGSMPTATQRVLNSDGLGGYTISCCKDTNSEHSRINQKVRIENPDDPTQFIIVNRVRQIEFGKKSIECNDPFTDVGVASALAEIDASVSPIFAPADDGACKSTYSFTVDPA